jgi:hypothetical protein
MNDAIHAARYVQKLDSQLIGSFSSLPAGPIGQLRNGRPLLYHTSLPPFPHRPSSLAIPMLPPASVSSDASAEQQKKSLIRDRVLVWPITLGCGDFLVPDDLLQTLDGVCLVPLSTPLL